MNNKGLIWRDYLGLKELYESGRTQLKVISNNYIRDILLEERGLISKKLGKSHIILAEPEFANFYELHFKHQIDIFFQFLEQTELGVKANHKFTEFDLVTLQFISKQKDELLKGITVQRTFSSIVFKGMGSKYLDERPRLLKAVCKLLGIEGFPDKGTKSGQWRLVIDCTNPTSIVLCENLNALKYPDKAREKQVELWYVGGNNIRIVNEISVDKLKLPLFYSCDWDLDGLKIYCRLRKIMDEKGVHLRLLVPLDLSLSMPTTSPNHKSHWQFHLPFSGLEPNCFEPEALKIIDQLLRIGHWIEEESFDFYTILQDLSGTSQLTGAIDL